MVNRTVIIISPEPWDANAVSKHHYALTLADQGFTVLFLGPPSRGRDVEINPSGKHANLFVVKAPSVARGLRFYPALLRRWLERRWLQRLEMASGFTIGTVWLFENSRFFDMRFAGNRLKIYHQVDLNQNFHVQLAASTADICFCTTDFIQAQLAPFNSCVYKIHHGTAIPVRSLPLRTEQLGWLETGLNVVYIGNLDMLYLDAELLTQVVQAHPTVRFHFVGNYTASGSLRRQTINLQNVVWWGKVPSALIPSILERSDIVLCTYKAAQYRDQLASPHKFMEYLASGKTIVATYTDEYKDKRHLLKMVDSSSDFLTAFAEVINNLDEYNSADKQAMRVDYASQHSYDRQLDQIISFLIKNGLGKK